MNNIHTIEDNIVEDIYGYYPNGYASEDVKDIVKLLRKIYPNVDKKIITEIVESNLHE